LIRLDWRPALIYTHRWLGIAGCIVFLVWFVSGVVMMYERMPRLTAEERLARLRPVDLSAFRVAPLDALAKVDVLVPERMRLSTLGDRPVYRLYREGQWSTVFADTGDVLDGLGEREATDVARQFMPEHAATIRYDQRLTTPDQWTIDGGMPRFLPLHRLDVGDAAQTQLYVSDVTGEVVMKTTARGRTWGYLGAVLHWTYFTPFRLQPGLWRWSIIYTALIGCILCLSGLAIGVWRLSPFKRYRLKRVPSHSPYSGLMWWHHYAGLLFGLAAFTWSLSGALSLTPWDWAPSSAPTSEQLRNVRGGALRLDRCSLPAVLRAAGGLRAEFVPKEYELLQLLGQPFLLAYRPPSSPSVGAANPDLRAFLSPHLALEHRLARIGDAASAFDRFSNEEMVAAAAAAMPGVPERDAMWLTDYDAYYYDRHRMSPLPVLRVRYADPGETWLYFAPTTGAVVMKQERLSRLNRWLYNGLHSLDFPGLYTSRPAWDILVIVLTAGGIAILITPVVAAWRRLRRHAARWRRMSPTLQPSGTSPTAPSVAD